jgi:haloalkane dehalogenase
MAEAAVSDVERRFGLAPGEYPFRSHFHEIGGSRLHYVDEGQGPVLLMLHGNPAWSFLYRRIIKAFSPLFRCVAVDLAGFGLSEPPPGFSFRPEDQARLVAGLVEALDLREVTLIGHDWGGPIGLGALLQSGSRFTRICLGNSWAWPVNGDFHFEWFSKLMGGPVGRFGTEHFCVFVNAVMPASMRRRKLTEAEMRACRAPFPKGRTRAGMHVLPWQITAAGPWLRELERGISSFKGRVHFIWPENDIAFRAKELGAGRRCFPLPA